MLSIKTKIDSFDQYYFGTILYTGNNLRLNPARQKRLHSSVLLMQKELPWHYQIATLAINSHAEACV